MVVDLLAGCERELMNPKNPEPKAPRAFGELTKVEKEHEAASRLRMLQLFQERYDLSAEQAERKMREFEECYRL
jgi:hypothetical protein